MTMLPALPVRISEIVEEFEFKAAAIEDEIAALNDAVARMKAASCVQGVYAGPVMSHEPYVHERDVRRLLLKSAWTAAYRRLNIESIASATDKKLFERSIEDPAPFTIDNIRATFGDYLLRTRFHILRGMAEAFCALDPAYKSHSKVKIGVKGLPKRVIIGYWGSYSSSFGKDRFKDIVNALAAYRGQPLISHEEFLAIEAAHRAGEDAVLDGREIVSTSQYETRVYKTQDRGITVRKFANGNAHVFFTPASLRDINRALAEFYGEVLPDAEDDDAKPRASTSVSKDLQYYPTPKAVIDAILSDVRIAAGIRVLEPSCGCGRILDAIREAGGRGFGIEVDSARAAQARQKGHAVLTGNFLEQPASPDFDMVVMNPPFYGRHYVKHLLHALEFLKPGGRLVSILPASAWYDHGELADLNGQWSDLPPGSFSESGTNVPTGYFSIWRKST